MTSRPTRWVWVWLAALAAVVSLELYAVVDRRSGDTLSENVQLLSLAKNPWVRWPTRVVVLALCAWLGVHLSFGILP